MQTQQPQEPFFNVVPLFPSSVIMVNVQEDTSELLNPNGAPVMASASSDPTTRVGGNVGDAYYWGTGSEVRVLERFPTTKKILLDTFTAVAEQALGYKKKDYAITTSWLTTSNRGEGSIRHCHKNSFYSCVYYFQEEYPEGTGGIVFDNPNVDRVAYYFQNSDIDQVNPSNSLSCTFKPEPNLMLVFPSYLNHNVLQHGIDTQRKSLAFNVVPLGAYGEHDSSFDYSWVTPSLASWKSK